jgi:putative peptidoglycan lipid II flippase
MGLGSVVSRLLGVVRNGLLVACVGGLTGASAAFQTANTLPNIIFLMLSTGFITATLVPQITQAMALPTGGREKVDRLLTLALGLVVVLGLVAPLAANPLMSCFQLRGEVRDLGIFFAYLCLPQVAFYGLYAVLGQVLNARGVFAPVMWSPVLANLVQLMLDGIVFVVAFAATAWWSRVPDLRRVQASA